MNAAEIRLAAEILDLEQFAAEPDTLPAQAEQARELAARYRQQLADMGSEIMAGLVSNSTELPDGVRPKAA